MNYIDLRYGQIEQLTLQQIYIYGQTDVTIYITDTFVVKLR